MEVLLRLITTVTTTSVIATVGNGTTGTVTVTTPGGTATSGAPFTVIPDLSAVNITPGTPQSFCATGGLGSLLTASETGGGTITGRQWGKRSTPGGAITAISGATGNTYTPTGAALGVGTWYIVCTSTPTCGSAVTSNEVTITVNTPTANAGAALADICKGSTSAALGGSVGGTATGGTWSDGGVGGTFNPNATTLNATWTPPASYTGTATLTLTTSGGACGTTTASKTQLVDGTCQVVTLTQPTQLTATISGGGGSICSGQSSNITVTISGGTAPYKINTIVQSGAGPFTFPVTPGSTTTYTSGNITVSDANSCTSTTGRSATIMSIQPPP